MLKTLLILEYLNHPPHVKIHEPQHPSSQGLERLKRVRVNEAMRETFSDIRGDCNEVIIQGNTAVQRYICSMKRTGRSAIFP